MTVIPKRASTVVLMDRKSRVYLTKRPITMKFLGGYYVFPGGTVDEQDETVGSNLVMNRPNLTLSPAYYIAAARELFEEVGVLLARHADGRPVMFNEEKERDYRQRLIKGQMSFVDLLKRENLHFDFNHLKYFGTLVTPEGSPYRFDTSFFLADLPEGQSPVPDAYEIENAFWATPEEALSAYAKGKLPMISPTILSLETIINHKKGNPLQLPKNPNLF